MKQHTHYDLTRCSFEEFILFLFARTAPGGVEQRRPWYWDAEVTFDPQHLCECYLRLFRQPGFLAERFSKAQLEQGFWAILGPNLSCAVVWLIWNDALALPKREEVVRSMLNLFTGLFVTEPLDTSVDMWWDSLCYAWHCGNRKRERGGEDASMQDVIFQTLSSLLEVDSAICQGAALHGLGHLHHPETEQLIQRYLTKRPHLGKAWRDYALAAGRFEVM